MATIKQHGLYVYRAYDKDGFPVKEAYSKQKLLQDLAEEFHATASAFKIKRIFVKGLE